MKRLVAKYVGSAAELKLQCEDVLGERRTLKVACECTKSHLTHKYSKFWVWFHAKAELGYTR